MSEKEEKKQLRRELKACIRSLPESYRGETDRRIAERLYRLEVYRRAAVIFAYVGTSVEIDTLPILLHALADGKRVCAPLITGPGVMEARFIEGSDSLARGAYGILEPKAMCPPADPSGIGLTLVPCLSCSKNGVRLGYGGGYYDRFLKRCSGVKLALCRGRLVRERLPREPHDQPVDGLITEEFDIFFNS